MGNQYSDASTGEFDEGGAPADGAAGHNAELAIGGGGGSGGFAPPASQDSQEARVARLESFERLPAAESVPVPGAGGMGQVPSHEIMRDTCRTLRREPSSHRGPRGEGTRLACNVHTVLMVGCKTFPNCSCARRPAVTARTAWQAPR